MNIVEAQGILQKLGLETLDAIEQGSIDLGCVTRKLNAVPHRFAFVECLHKFQVRNHEAFAKFCRTFETTLILDRAPRGAAWRDQVTRSLPIKDRALSFRLTEEGRHPMGHSTALTTGAGNSSSDLSHNDVELETSVILAGQLSSNRSIYI